MQKLNQPVRGTLIAASALALALGLSACNKQNDGTTVGQKLDSAVAKTEQAAGEAKADAKSAMASAESSMKSSGSEVKSDAKDAAANVSATVDDVSITASVSAALVKDPDLSAIKINVDTKAGVVSLRGPAPTAAAKGRAEEIARAVKGVSSVDNQLEIKSM